jgi:hypothetical protein
VVVPTSDEQERMDKIRDRALELAIEGQKGLTGFDLANLVVSDATKYEAYLKGETGL